MAPINVPPKHKKQFGIIPDDYVFAQELEAQRRNIEGYGNGNDEDNEALRNEAPLTFANIITDALIDYLTANQNASKEPPHKRQKLVTGSELQSLNDHVSGDYIVVKESSWEIRCLQPKLSSDSTTLSKQKIRFNCLWDRQNEKSGPSHIIIENENGNTLLIIPLSLGNTSTGIPNPFNDVLICLMVDRDSKKHVRQSSKLWTEAGISLHKRDGSDYIQIHFTIKWGVATHPESIQLKKTDALLKVLNTYFPDPNRENLDPLSAQDFYQSAHSSDPDDEIPASIETPRLKSTLYPFQKRAVQWLLRREGVEWSRATANVREAQFEVAGQLPVSFIAATDLKGRSFYVSHLYGIVTFNPAPFFAMEREIKGGILAEEMGLGKTVEIIALLTLHTRPNQGPSTIDPFSGENLQTTNATLIISPPSISKQWISEIKTHAPHLKVTYYEGIKSRTLHHEAIMDDFATSDIVITTYAILASEIHFTSLNPGRTLRRESKYRRPKSPLIQFSWWRVCLDEAQMIESSVSNAAIVARMIPRINAWVITGTPVRKNIKDLLGLLIFLRYEPIVSLWPSFVSSKQDFHKLFGSISLRHSKQSVRKELKLPKQRRFVITMPFNAIEEAYYQELFSQMCEESALTPEGKPLMYGWDPKDYAEVMRRWLVRLRQVTLHAEGGGRKKRTIRQNGSGDDSEPVIQAASKVLEVMFSQTDVAIRTNHRSLLLSRLKRGQLYEDSPRVQEALKIWEAVILESSVGLGEARDELIGEISSEKAKRAVHLEKGSNAPSQSAERINEEEVEGQDGLDPASPLGLSRAQLRAALELHHMAVFFRANAHFQIKTNEEMTKPDSPEFKNLDILERQGYEEAKDLRREILQDAFNKANSMMITIRNDTESRTPLQLPKYVANTLSRGTESRRIMEDLERLGIHLDNQAHQINEWRDHLRRILLSTLVDNDDDEVAISGDEYENSTKVQEEVVVYVQALRTMIADRQASLSGIRNYLTDEEAKNALREAKRGEGPYPERLLELFNVRDRFVHERNSVRGTLSALRTLVSKLKANNAQNELSIVESQLKMTHKQLMDQTKVAEALEKEVGLFTKCMNFRVEYYKQLQAISNQVAPYAGPNNDDVVVKMLGNEQVLIQRLATLRAKKRYLVHLKEETESLQDTRMCIICRDGFELGVLTVCGHQFCSICIKQWWKSHHSCPVCKKKLIHADLHEITYKPQEPTLTTETEEVREPLKERSLNSNTPQKSAIYSDFSRATLSAIKNVELPGNNSFGTKIDTLARHILYLRESDPGSKSIVFSQFAEFLPILARAFRVFRIGHASIDKPNGIEIFKNDPNIEVFLLHSRAHSAGLTLVNASHVFICEPLLNTALEIQAVARVDRIGQLVDTNVYLHIIGNTVEQSIYELSVKRRLEHLGHAAKSKKGKERELSDEELVAHGLEEADSKEMQESILANLIAKGKSGEVVSENDLWTCLFGGRTKRDTMDLTDDATGEDPMDVEDPSGSNVV
ncbi:hypothetical protein sscle_05g044980 [Sclerotinia sclerotiorum 1980 UF-70]|uniref:RING-type domain-containing protein n=1 Tax=Sclerotinia sclerotiorum (strain ATCC 18683 / 1980 / Ss-1) TaxID=665079 RepID=A0A1D9Q459_SCLS1|nr:hypothetical protein sscle_05g044980 [Sclerotinia sclerotiorum 1980 UF-70]